MARILVVDDMAVLREPIAAALRQKGHDAMCVGDGRAAIDALDDYDPDLILLDMAMPNMDGLEFLRRYRQRPLTRHVPVIMLTAIADKAKVVEAAKLGIKDYMLKSSFSLNDLFGKVSRLLPETEAVSEAAPPAPASAGASAGASAASTGAASGGAAPPAGAAASAAGASGAPMSAEVPQSSAQASQMLKDLKPLMTRSEIKELLDSAEDVKAFSPTVALLLKVTNNPNCSIDEIVKVISNDHALSLKILKMANSSAYSRGQASDTVREGVVRIGLAKIRQAVLSIGVIEHFAGQSKGFLDMALFWEHAIAVGIIAAEISVELELEEPDEAFTAGLLHDVGRIVFLERLGDHYQRVLQEANRLSLPIERVEKRLLFYTHADVMDRALHRWGFPPNLINPIVFHHLSMGNIRQTAPREAQKIGVVALANRLAHAMMMGSSGNEFLYGVDDFVEALKMSPRAFEKIVTETPEKALDVKLALMSQIATGDWLQLKQKLLHEAPAPIRPLFVGVHPETDACALWCKHMGDRFDEEPPNVALVHVARTRDAQPLVKELLKREAEAGVAPLPVMALSPTGDTHFAKETGRRVYEHTMPVRLERLIKSLCKLIEQGPGAPSA